MKDPFRDANASLRMLEEFERQQRQLEKLFGPYPSVELAKRAQAATVVAEKFEMLQRSKLLDYTTSNAFLRATEQAMASTKLISNAAAALDAAHKKAIADAERFAEFDKIAAAAQFTEIKALEIAKFSEIAARRIRPFESIIEAHATWEATLASRMGGIGFHWALTEAPLASAEAFARLSRLADVSRVGPVYTDETTEILIDELGEPNASPDLPETVEAREARYDEAGRARELIAFPPAGYGQIMISAGYAVTFPPPPLVVIEEGLVEPVRYTPEIGTMLQSLEAHFRVFISERLAAIEGHAWVKRRVPEATRQKWEGRQTDAKEAGKPVYALIHYADFMDLADVVINGKNWSQFAAAFVSKDNLRLSLQRLYFIRNDIAHARPVGASDMLMAVTEATFLFRALGLSVTYGA